ncbi:MAG: hypothetical protein IKY83_03075, partial [Proteobacteria bacterium]|nr:hypothetical protein [Pseudomonadota bacterium]
MTDERDPQNNGINDNASPRPGMPDRGNPRPPSGRFPAIAPGRANMTQGRFSQSGMPAIGRANPSAAPAAPAP